MMDKRSGYSMKHINGIELIFYERKVCAHLSLCGHTLGGYHFHLDHPGVVRLVHTNRKVFY